MQLGGLLWGFWSLAVGHPLTNMPLSSVQKETTWWLGSQTCPNFKGVLWQTRDYWSWSHNLLFLTAACPPSHLAVSEQPARRRSPCPAIPQGVWLKVILFSQQCFQNQSFAYLLGDFFCQHIYLVLFFKVFLLNCSLFLSCNICGITGVMGSF